MSGASGGGAPVYLPSMHWSNCRASLSTSNISLSTDEEAKIEKKIPPTPGGQIMFLLNFERRAEDIWRSVFAFFASGRIHNGGTST